MPDLWQAQGIYKKVRHLQNLLSELCFGRQTAGCRQIELVRQRSAVIETESPDFPGIDFE
jgi:hypothetical protein